MMVRYWIAGPPTFSRLESEDAPDHMHDSAKSACAAYVRHCHDRLKDALVAVRCAETLYRTSTGKDYPA